MAAGRSSLIFAVHSTRRPVARQEVVAMKRLDDMRARAEHGLAECRAGLAEDGDKVLDRLFARRGRDGSLERAMHKIPGWRSREQAKPMSDTLTLLFIRQCGAVPVDKMHSPSAWGT